MNYPQTLAKAKTLLQQKHHAQAVQTAASVLDNLLVDLYNEMLSQSPPARQKQLIEAIEQVGSGQPLNKLTLGKLVGLYRASRAYKDLQKTLELSLTFLNVNVLGPLVDIRNRAVHEGHETALAEQLLKKEAPQPQPRPEPTEPPTGQPGPTGPSPPGPTPPPSPPPAIYRRVTIDTPVDWRQWYDFYQAIIKPLVEAGAEVNLQLRIEASGDVEANLVDLSVKESVVQFNPQGKVEAE